MKNKLYNLNNEKKGIDTQNKKHKKKIKPSLKQDNKVKSDYFTQANIFANVGETDDFPGNCHRAIPTLQKWPGPRWLHRVILTNCREQYIQNLEKGKK